jgi:tetratricopeptide (TPR) repeat protein
MKLLVLLAAFQGTTSDALDPGVNPVQLDRTGIQWVTEFSVAESQARENHRLLLVLADNFAPTHDGSFGFEGFRAGALSDPRVRRLINQRFIPTYLNVFSETAAFDRRGFEFVTRVKKELAKEEQTFQGGMPVLFMAPTGRLLEEIKSSYSADQTLEAMLKVLKKNPKYNSLSESEKNLTALEEAHLKWSLQDYRGAKKALKEEKGETAQLLLAKMAREEGDFKGMMKSLRSIKSAELQDERAMEQAYQYWQGKDYRRLARHLEPFPEDSDRIDEARYFHGMALYHDGKKDEALALWQQLVQHHEPSPWIYRADWAYVSAKLASNPAGFAGRGNSPSLLGRMFYRGYNPEMQGPPRRK